LGGGTDAQAYQGANCVDAANNTGGGAGGVYSGTSCTGGSGIVIVREP
jgi:hypothetical protein